ARKTGHADLSSYRSALDDGGPVEFTGYRRTTGESRLRALLTPGGEPLGAANPGDSVELVLDTTPFYAEGGGQQPDHGLIETTGGGLLRVLDVQQPIPGLIVHRAEVVEGEVRPGDEVEARIDVPR